MKFTKYHGTGNDFILIDNRQKQWENFVSRFEVQPVVLSQIPVNNKTYSKENIAVFELCHRYFGIGADGLMLLQPHAELDFEMVYFNSDGQPSSMCGNGGRCIAHFAASLGICHRTLENNQNRDECSVAFWAPDGKHSAQIKVKEQRVSLSMNPVTSVESYPQLQNSWVLNTGSPHFIALLNSGELESDLFNNDRDESFVTWAKSIRYNSDFSSQGINVNRVLRIGEAEIAMRTYERGVENETLSCGTGVTAAAIASFYSTLKSDKDKSHVHVVNNNAGHALHTPEFSHPAFPITIAVITKGGELSVSFNYVGNGKFEDVQLTGPVMPIFSGLL